MKKIDLISAMGYLSEETVLEAEAAREVTPKSNKALLVRLSALAACAALVIFAGVYIGRNSRLPVGPDPDITTPPTVTDPTGTTPPDVSILPDTDPTVTEPTGTTLPDSSIPPDTEPSVTEPVGTTAPIVTEPIYDNLPNLTPSLIVEGMGFEGFEFTEEEIAEMKASGIWKGPDYFGQTLPVYAKKIVQHKDLLGSWSGYSVEELYDSVRKYAAMLGYDPNEIEITDDAMSEEEREKDFERFREWGEPGVDDPIMQNGYGMAQCVETRQDDVMIGAYVYGLSMSGYEVEMVFTAGQTRFGLPEELRFGKEATEEEALLIAEYLLDEFEVTDFRGINPIESLKYEIITKNVGYFGETEERIRLTFYNRDYENEKNDFALSGLPNICAIFEIDFDGYYRDISIQSFERAYKYIGHYPIISSLDEVIERVEQGKYLTTAIIDEDPKIENIGMIELKYRTDGIPYFRLLIDISDELLAIGHIGPEEGYRIYAAYYTPAVVDKYIDGSTPWDGSFN